MPSRLGDWSKDDEVANGAPMVPEWRSSHVDMLCEEFGQAARFFHEHVIGPASRAIAEVDPGVEGGVSSSDESYALAVGAREARKALALSLAGLWESQFREHTWKSAAIIAPGSKVIREIETCKLARLEAIFIELRDFPLDHFASYGTLRGLVQIANCARHGNGPSSAAAYSTYPAYFSPERPHNGWYSYFLHGAAGENDVRHIDIQPAHLDQFASAVEDFWAAVWDLSVKSGEW